MDKTLLLAQRLPQGTVDVPGVGTVTVRGLSRAEVLALKNDSDADSQEARILALGLVDPALTVAEAGQWRQAATAGELELVTEVIVNLSGLNPEADKQAVKTFRDGSGTGVHLLPSTETGDDGGETPGGDV